MSSIKEDWENFADPMKQAIKNLGNNIKDAIDDAMDKRENSSTIDEKDRESTRRNKGCSWNIIKWVLVLSVIGALLSECNNTPVDDSGITTDLQNTTQSTVTEGTAKNYLGFLWKQVEYAGKYNIRLHRFPDEEARLANWIENSDESTVYLTTDNIFGADRYKITEKYDGYLYCGELKDGRPDGYGILFAVPEERGRLLTYKNYGFACRYIGHFSDGQFDGFGVLFTESENGYSFVSRLRPYDETTGENVAEFLTWANYAEYFGEFSDGNMSVLGNSFHLSDSYIGAFENALSQIDLDNPSYRVEVGEYKKNRLNGANKQYIGGYLYYNGESKDGMFNGHGVLYYYGTNIPRYKGEFKNDMRHGTGTSYSETGKVIYQGKWKNDDYA